jgi:phosphate starvation-inducible PhoH-like protein
MSKNKFKDEEDFKEIMTVDNTSEIQKIKQDIAGVLKNDIKIVAKNDSQKKLINSIKNNEITISAGRAGCGKTYVAVAYALSLLRKTSNRFKKIYLVKSVTPIKGEELGFIKGDWKEKVEPFMWSYYINMEKLILESTLKYLIDKDYIKPFPLAYMRGASLDDCIIIADEMQNVSLGNARTLLTRIGSNCKLILLGDFNQIDIKETHLSSLKTLIENFKDINNIGVIEMNNSDTNIRNPLIDIIESKFNEIDEKNKNKKNRKISSLPVDEIKIDNVV